MKKSKFNVFHVNTDRIPPLTPDSFEPATRVEKDEMVTRHKSVSYWQDAFRRFKANKVSMVALLVFIIMLLFSFLGPALIPFGYDTAYRSAMKLGPFEYSASEQAAREQLKTADAVFANNMQAGSVTSVKAGEHVFKSKGKWYSFTLDAKMSQSLLVFDADAEKPLLLVTEENYLKSKMETAVALEVTPLSAKPADAHEIEMATGVFPHVFGTDSAGRDIMARCMYGGRVSILVGIIASMIVLVIGATYGSISGLFGGKVDFVMMRIVELIYSVPDVLVVLLLQVVLQSPLQKWFDNTNIGAIKALGSLGVGIVSIFITFALLYWVSMARIIRGQVLQIKQQEYVTAATVLGAPKSRIIKRHLLPNCVGQLVITTCLQIPSAIFLESFLSFLGLGVSAPMASLGSLCADALDTITLFPYRMLCPAILLSLIVLSLNLVGDGLRDALDPRLKK